MAFEFAFDPDRLTKLERIRANDIDPYGGKFSVKNNALQVREGFEKLQGTETSIAGRIIGKRSHGELEFLDLADESGRVQIYIVRKDLDESSRFILENLDTGDIIGVAGKIVKTKTGEISVQPGKITLLSKSLLPIPSKWYGLEDTEKRYRKRYLDFIINTESREKIRKGSLMVSKIREILVAKGFLEVIVPTLHPILGGANAKPFITHYNALDRDLYLKIASELYLKRMLVGGFEKIFDISKNFRNEGMDTRHNPEFMMLELYQAYGDLGTMLEISEELVKGAIFSANNTYKVQFGDRELDFSKFQIKTMEDSVKEATGLKSESEIIEAAKGINPKVLSYGEAINELFENKVSDNIVQPTFITRFPIEVSPLAKKTTEDKRFVYRFELYVAGIEIVNAFSELNDPIDQVSRFNTEAERKQRGIDETQEFDRDFIEAMGYGMPPAGGLGLGIDRLQMLGTNSKSIKEVIPFPQLRTIED
ncbi:lysine--tRNA ligase [Candidatus Parvarchaeota archaeon]|nr:lysine--tRNA ligase [Candidatus Parvarchaeota archaeon]